MKLLQSFSGYIEGIQQDMAYSDAFQIKNKTDTALVHVNQIIPWKYNFVSACSCRINFEEIFENIIKNFSFAHAYNEFIFLSKKHIFELFSSQLHNFVQNIFLNMNENVHWDFSS